MKIIRLIGLILIVLALTFGLWFLAVPLSEAVGAGKSSQALSRLGATGDLFGSITSFFSGLAALGLIVILVLDRDTRLGSNPPFLSIQDRKATIKNASFDDDGMDLQISIEIGVRNLTSAPALNPSLQVHSSARWDISGEDVPIAGDSPVVFIAKLNLRGDRGERLLESINTTDGFILPVELSYSALNKTHWTSKASLRLSTPARERTSVTKILQRDASEYIRRDAGTGTADLLDINAAFVADTWEHARK